MNIKLILVFCSCLGLADCILHAQAGSATTTTAPTKEFALPIRDSSPTVPPLKIFGTVIAKDQRGEVLRYSLASDLSIVNVSPKPILAFAAQIDFRPPFKIAISHPLEDEYFFQSHALLPDAVRKFVWTFGPVGEPQGPYDPSFKPRDGSVETRVIFVQFLDGSMWGDAAASERFMNRRRQSMTELENLVAVSRTEGESKFLHELSRPTQLEPIWALQRLYEEEKTVGPVVTKIVEMLRNACVHENGMVASR